MYICIVYIYICMLVLLYHVCQLSGYSNCAVVVVSNCMKHWLARATERHHRIESFKVSSIPHQYVCEMPANSE